MSDLDQAAPVASRGKANAFGYAACALADPLGFDAYVEVASSSVVTTSFEENDCYFEQARCFQLMIQIIRETIRDGGGTDSPWVLFENSLVMWCFAHGIAHGLTKASLRFFPEQLKRELIGPIFDISLSSLMRRLGLNLDGFIELSVVRSTC